MLVMKCYVLVTYGMAFLSSGERERAKAGRTRVTMAMHTATYGRSVSHSRAKAEVAIFVELRALKGAKR